MNHATVLGIVGVALLLPTLVVLVRHIRFERQVRDAERRLESLRSQ